MRPDDETSCLWSRAWCKTATLRSVATFRCRFLSKIGTPRSARPQRDGGLCEHARGHVSRPKSRAHAAICGGPPLTSSRATNRVPTRSGSLEAALAALVHITKTGVLKAKGFFREASGSTRRGC